MRARVRKASLARMGQQSGRTLHGRGRSVDAASAEFALVGCRGVELYELVEWFTTGLALADSERPVAVNLQTGKEYLPGIGPFSESATTRLAFDAPTTLRREMPPVTYEVPYPTQPKNHCDVIINEPAEWAVEIKMLRFMEDEGKLNDNTLMHILSPYPANRSALTDCTKLVASGFDTRKAILIFGYDYDGWSMDPAIEAFEILAERQVDLVAAAAFSFDGLAHPVHERGRAFGWELLPLT